MHNCKDTHLCIFVLAATVLVLTSLACDMSTVIPPAQTAVAQIDPTKIIESATEVAVVVSTMSAVVEVTKLRAEIITRARTWVDDEVSYGSFDDDPTNDYHDGYRADCSGYVSYAWQLRKNGNEFSATTVTLSEYTIEIPFDDLQPGDIINNQRELDEGHVVIFVSWLDSSHTQFLALEENYSYGKAVQTTLSLEQIEGGLTIKEYNDNAPGPYYAQRLESIP